MGQDAQGAVRKVCDLQPALQLLAQHEIQIFMRIMGVVEDQRLPGKHLDGEERTLSQRMFVRQCHQNVPVPYPLHSDSGGQGFAVIRRVADILPPGENGFHLLLRRDLLQNHLNIRIALAKMTQITHQFPAEYGIPGKPDSHRAGLSAQGSRNGVSGKLGLLQRASCLGLEQFSRFSQLDASAGPKQQRAAEFLLQRTNLHTQRRLDNVQALSGAAKMLLFRHGQKIA